MTAPAGRAVEPGSPRALWRDRNRAAGYHRSWLDTIPPSAVDAVLALHEHGPMTGSVLAARTTGQQANMTARTLPRLALTGFVTSAPGLPDTPSAHTPTVWELTSLGRDLARGLIENGENRS